MRGIPHFLVLLVGSALLATPAFACGLYGLDHHLDNGTFEWAPFEPSKSYTPKASKTDPALVTPKTPDDKAGQERSERPSFARSTQDISNQARRNVQNRSTYSGVKVRAKAEPIDAPVDTSVHESVHASLALQPDLAE